MDCTTPSDRTRGRSAGACASFGQRSIGQWSQRMLVRGDDSVVTLGDEGPSPSILSRLGPSLLLGRRFELVGIAVVTPACRIGSGFRLVAKNRDKPQITLLTEPSLPTR